MAPDICFLIFTHVRHVRDDVERFYGNCKLELSYNSILENPWPY